MRFHLPDHQQLDHRYSYSLYIYVRNGIFKSGLIFNGRFFNGRIEENVTIHPNTYITGNSIIKKNSQIGPNTEIHNSIIGEGVTCKHSLVYNSRIQEFSTVGPFAHLRDGADIGPRNRIGNFVEVKKSTTGTNTKASHLAYIGDATIGKNVNFGCGAITVNYDGKNNNNYIMLKKKIIIDGCTCHIPSYNNFYKMFLV